MKRPDYRGRFAPSPTGTLHFGSLVAALGSYLEAKQHQGIWLVRIEDVDTPRTMPGAADDILRTLERFGMYWDGDVIYQSRRSANYEDGLQQLLDLGAVYPCACTRKEIADSALQGIDGQIYPGTCRKGIPSGRSGRAWRVMTNNIPITFDDALQGTISQQLENEIGDFVVKRADGLFAYQLAVVVDDNLQGITHIVRGADLLASTPRQIYLQNLLGYTEPQYMHLPVAVNRAGEKLSKQTLAPALNPAAAGKILWEALKFLRQNPPVELSFCKPDEILQWAVSNWNNMLLKSVTRIRCDV